MTVVKLIGIECNEFINPDGETVRYAKLYGQKEMPTHRGCIGQKVASYKADYKYISECFDDLQLYIGETVRLFSDHDKVEEIRLYN